MSKYELIEMVGVSGRIWPLSGTNRAPVSMAPNSTGLYETAVKTLYTDAAYGQHFEGVQYPATTVVWTANVGADFERQPKVWESLYSDFRADLSYTDPVTIRYTSSDGTRERKLRLQSEPKPFSQNNFEGHDPRLFTFGSLVVTMQTELPFYVGPTVIYEEELPNLVGGASTWFPITISNPGDVEIWPKWALTDQATWVLPDSSCGSNAYGRATIDYDRTTRPLTLLEGEGATVDSFPDTQTVRAENDSLVQARWSDDLLYPVQPQGPAWTGKGDFTVRVMNCTNPDGAALRLYLPRWYLTPFSRPRITL